MEAFGDVVINCINDSNLKDVKVKTYGYKDIFIEHGTIEELEHKYGLDKESILTDLYLHKNDKMI